ncbi:MAG: hypothetical protein ACNA71_05450 [Kiritimatiellia bacterium]
MKIIALLLLVSGLFVAGCRQHDWRELAIDVPEMHNDAALRLVMQAIMRGPGIKPDSVVVDPQARRVRLTYDSLLAADMNFVHLVVMAGFDANGIPGDPEARAAWPAEVRP